MTLDINATTNIENYHGGNWNITSASKTYADESLHIEENSTVKVICLKNIPLPAFKNKKVDDLTEEEKTKLILITELKK